MVVQPKNIYIDDADGDDANDGTQALPVKTEAQARLLAVDDGDTIMGLRPCCVAVGEIMNTYNSIQEA
jgi:hypothetical protein